MELIARFKTGENVLVERYEGEQLVGKRKLYFNDFVASLSEQLNISDVLHQVVSRQDEYENYLEHLVDSNDFTEFLVSSMKYASKQELQSNKTFQAFLAEAIKKIDVHEVHPEQVNKLFRALLKNVKELPSEPVYMELLDTMITRIISDDKKTELLERVFPQIISMAENMKSPHLRKWFELALPKMDPLWLVEALATLKEASEVKLAQIEIPNNCVFVNITTKQQIYVLEIPKTRMRVKFHDIPFEDVGHPRMICVVSVSNKRVNSMRLFALPNEGIINNSTPVYHYPYSNVYGDGRVCWNGYTKEEINGATDVEMMPKLFLSGSNNSHLKANVKEMFEALEGKDFPDEQLRPFGKTLKELIG